MTVSIFGSISVTHLPCQKSCMLKIWNQKQAAHDAVKLPWHCHWLYQNYTVSFTIVLILVESILSCFNKIGNLIKY